jgi:hypothetical protein
MQYNSYIYGILSILALSMFWSCQPKTEYEKVKARELKSGKVVEELFLNLHLGMQRKDFFTTCWEWNKKGVLVNGSHQLMVHYKPEMPSGKDTDMYFYPDFEDNKIFFMPMEFIYTGWFPTNEEFTNDKLMPDVLELMENWYGKGFFEVSNKEQSIKAMVKIDGNRLIRIFKKNINTVRVEILDLRIKDITDLNKNKDAA